jgi:hypothetical protein
LRWIKKSGDTSLLAAHAVVWLRPATREVMSALALVTIVYLLSVYLGKALVLCALRLSRWFAEREINSISQWK